MVYVVPVFNVVAARGAAWLCVRPIWAGLDWTGLD